VESGDALQEVGAKLLAGDPPNVKNDHRVVDGGLDLGMLRIYPNPQRTWDVSSATIGLKRNQGKRVEHHMVAVAEQFRESESL